jgi:Domain of unknown function (DUF4159)
VRGLRRRTLWLGLAAAVLAIGIAVPVAAQRFYGRDYFANQIPYTGEFTLVRLWYPYFEGWAFDWPEMEQNLGRILESITALKPNFRGSNIIRMDSPEFFKFPVAYLSEPGYWHPSDAEVATLRAWIQKGGFLIIDDFHYPNEWAVFEQAMNRVLPDGRIDRLDITHPVFNSFFQIRTLDVPYPGPLGERGLMGEFYGIHEDNDPRKRLMVVINYNMDIGDYMEWSATGRYSVSPTNEAYKFGINYLIYGLTH